MVFRVVDLETACLTPPESGASGVCEVGWHDVVEISGDYTVNQVGYGTLIDPGMSIPPEISAVHHITDEDVAFAPDWSYGVERLVTPDVDVFVAHQAKFERQFITKEMTGKRPWICTYRCALRLWPDAPSHSNQALRYLRRPLGLVRELAAVSHRAQPDAYVTAFHVRDMLKIARIEDLIRWTEEPALQVICHIGQWRGKKWSEVDLGFLHWVTTKNFDEDVMFTVTKEIERREAQTSTTPTDFSQVPF